MVRALTDEVTRRLRRSLTGSADTPLVLVGNFEVEDRWAVGEHGLPAVGLAPMRRVVNRMDEFGLLLAGGGDHVLLKEPPEPAYLAYLDDLGIPLPTVLAAGSQDPDHMVTEDALADAGLVAELGALATGGAWLWPHGVSDLEERLAARSGLPLAGPPAAVCKAVNSKVYSRLVAAATGVRQAEGLVCRDVDELLAAVAQAGRWLAAGRPVVLKDAYGVSGKGILVVRDERRLDQVRRMIVRRAERSGDRRLALVVEKWLPKRTDLNYQFTLDRDGTVRFDFVREAVTEAGVHKGHRLPAPLGARQHDEIRETAVLLGERLAADGYFGVVGVDALVTVEDRLYPMVEINARNNMSTYQERLRRRFFDAGQHVLARQYPVRPRRRVSFAEVRDLLAGLLLLPGADAGVLVNNFATVNAAAPPAGAPGGGGFDGRLYAIVIAESAERVAALDEQVATRLAGLTA